MPNIPLVAGSGALVAVSLLASLSAPLPPAEAALTNPAVTTPASAPAVVLPVDPARLVRGFEPPSTRWGPGHRGVDLAAPAGTPVLSPAGGVVVFTGRVVDREVLTVRHADGLRSSLEPVAAVLPVGSVVSPGDVVGHVATGGHCSGCLHWGVRDGERYVDPLSLLGSDGTVRLLPRAVGRRRAPVSPARSPATTSAAAASPRCASGRSATR